MEFNKKATDQIGDEIKDFITGSYVKKELKAPEPIELEMPDFSDDENEKSEVKTSASLV